ncbi:MULTISPECIES: recombination-associated protein RdgC [unclassified Agarivorans]|uniref:recombination-associated protein RdgC n=1 Tax=unclassified Agarivorans TaxID=2636026 RepID=UPI0010DBB48C|nr:MULTISPECIES: recombination-associated protein RdgC [unclassified Agarivorans]MDO6686142.1 recombination-associated protein RdgC [Agarivorans sp. 3_MG-2023]MDO6716409.1 recombination-associated protein RdgC [Agarivorans sp. 2_MG-2023]GDY24278.1 recombination-associated protein RdgC [Agarivorans sp. Toyoura001]
MWFKNLMLFRITKELELEPEKLDATLDELSFSPCGSQDISKFGWVTPMGKFGQSLTHVIGNEYLVCAKKEEKMLPASVIRDTLADKVELIEQEQQRPLKKAEKDALKEEIVMTLLPRAFSRTSLTYAWVSPDNNLIAVDAGSAKKAEEVISLLRKSLGSLPVTPIKLANQADVTMTDWLNEKAIPANFELGEEAELRSALEGGGIIRCKEQDLFSDEIKVHLDADKFVTKLELTWADSIRFLISEDMSIKGVKFTDTITEQNEDIDKSDVAARFDADFALTSGELTKMIPDLIAALGGELTS